MKTKNIILINIVILISAIGIFIAYNFITTRNDFAPSGLNSNLLLSRTILAGNYLCRNQDAQGKFYYIVSPKGREVSKPNEYNTVRHLATAFSLLQLYDRAKNEIFLIHAKKAIEYSLKQFYNVTVDMIGYKGENKLYIGENAYCLMTLSYYFHVTNGDTYFLKQTNEIEKYSLSMIDKILKNKSMRGKKWAISQLCIGLILYNKFCKKMDDGSKKRIKGIIDYLVSLKTNDHWLPQAVYYYIDTYKIPRDEAKNYYEYVKKWGKNDIIFLTLYYYLTNLKIKKTNIKLSASCPLAANSEGYIAIYKLALYFNDKKTIKFFRNGIKDSIYNLLQHQYTLEGFIKKKSLDYDLKKIEGGWFNSTREPEIRIDNVCHNICFFMGAYNLMSKNLLIF